MGAEWASGSIEGMPKKTDSAIIYAPAGEPIPIRPRVTTYSLEEANQALQELKADRISGSGVLLIELLGSIMARNALKRMGETKRSEPLNGKD